MSSKNFHENKHIRYKSYVRRRDEINSNEQILQNDDSHDIDKKRYEPLNQIHAGPRTTMSGDYRLSRIQKQLDPEEDYLNKSLVFFSRILNYFMNKYPKIKKDLLRISKIRIVKNYKLIRRELIRREVFKKFRSYEKLLPCIFFYEARLFHISLDINDFIDLFEDLVLGQFYTEMFAGLRDFKTTIEEIVPEYRRMRDTKHRIEDVKEKVKFVAKKNNMGFNFINRSERLVDLVFGEFNGQTKKIACVVYILTCIDLELRDFKWTNTCKDFNAKDYYVNEDLREFARPLFKDRNNFQKYISPKKSRDVLKRSIAARSLKELLASNKD